LCEPICGTPQGSFGVGGYCFDPCHSGPRNFLIDRFLWHFAAISGSCRRRQSVADQSKRGVAATAAFAAPATEHAKGSPILIRIFKEESELEVWRQDTTGRFELFKVYPICRWSGDLGPNIQRG
jgi:murein L,D-transpeptidase YafK